MRKFTRTQRKLEGDGENNSRGLRRFANPPEDAADDAPVAILAQGDRLVGAIFGFKELRTVDQEESRED